MAEIGRRKGDAALLLALAAGQTVRDAARLSGVGERTATRRVADLDFRRRVAELRAEMIDRALGRMADGMADAAATLRRLLSAESESVRLGACRAMLELGVKLREGAELDQRNAGPTISVSIRAAIIAAGKGELEAGHRVQTCEDRSTAEGAMIAHQVPTDS